MLEVKPARVMELADQVLQLIADKTFSVPSPLKVMGISEVQAAFRLFQGGGHYGKMVVEMRPDDLIEVSDASLFLCYIPATSPTWLLGSN